MQAIECMAQSKDETCAYLCRLRRGRDRMMTKDFGAKLFWVSLVLSILGRSASPNSLAPAWLSTVALKSN